MAKLTNTDKELILADFHTGYYTVRQLADRYNVSHTAIHNITKGLEAKHREKVDTLISINTELQGESLQEVDSVKKVVDEVLRRQNAVYGVTEKALRIADKLLDQTDTMNDVKLAVELADRASLTLRVNERHAPKSETKVDVSQTNAVQFNIDLGE
jgi:hypothetical protein